MFEYALKQDCPVLIRYPKAVCHDYAAQSAGTIETGRGSFISKQNRNVLIICTGGIIEQVIDAAAILSKKDIIADLFFSKAPLLNRKPLLGIFYE